MENKGKTQERGYVKERIKSWKFTILVDALGRHNRASQLEGEEKIQEMSNMDELWLSGLDIFVKKVG